MAQKQLQALIVGGGLAGPCMALCLARLNIRSTIFELRSSRQTQGGSITLTPNALQVLDKYVGVYDQIRSRGFVYTRMGAFTDQAEKLGDIQVGYEEAGSYPAVRIMRSEVHDILLDAAEETKGLVEVKYGAKVKDIQEDETGVTASFEDGSTARGK